MLTLPPPVPCTLTMSRVPHRAQVRPFGGLSPLPCLGLDADEGAQVARPLSAATPPAFHTATAGNPLEGWTLSDAPARARPPHWQTGEHTCAAVRRAQYRKPRRHRPGCASSKPFRANSVHANHKKGSKGAEPRKGKGRQPRVFGVVPTSEQRRLCRRGDCADLTVGSAAWYGIRSGPVGTITSC
jgi:hypothetical protein